MFKILNYLLSVFILFIAVCVSSTIQNPTIAKIIGIMFVIWFIYWCIN